MNTTGISTEARPPEEEEEERSEVFVSAENSSLVESLVNRFMPETIMDMVTLIHLRSSSYFVDQMKRGDITEVFRQIFWGYRVSTRELLTSKKHALWSQSFLDENRDTDWRLWKPSKSVRRMGFLSTFLADILLMFVLGGVAVCLSSVYAHNIQWTERKVVFFSLMPITVVWNVAQYASFTIQTYGHRTLMGHVRAIMRIGPFLLAIQLVAWVLCIISTIVVVQVDDVHEEEYVGLGSKARPVRFLVQFFLLSVPVVTGIWVKSRLKTDYMVKKFTDRGVFGKREDAITEKLDKLFTSGLPQWTNRGQHDQVKNTLDAGSAYLSLYPSPNLELPQISASWRSSRLPSPTHEFPSNPLTMSKSIHLPPESPRHTKLNIISEAIALPTHEIQNPKHLNNIRVSSTKLDSPTNEKCEVRLALEKHKHSHDETTKNPPLTSKSGMSKSAALSTACPQTIDTFALLCPYRATTSNRIIFLEFLGPFGCYAWTILFTVVIGAAQRATQGNVFIAWLLSLAAAVLAEFGFHLLDVRIQSAQSGQHYDDRMVAIFVYISRLVSMSQARLCINFLPFHHRVFASALQGMLHNLGRKVRPFYQNDVSMEIGFEKTYALARKLRFLLIERSKQEPMYFKTWRASLKPKEDTKIPVSKPSVHTLHACPEHPDGMGSVQLASASSIPCEVGRRSSRRTSSSILGLRRITISFGQRNYRKDRQCPLNPIKFDGKASHVFGENVSIKQMFYDMTLAEVEEVFRRQSTRRLLTMYTTTMDTLDRQQISMAGSNVSTMVAYILLSSVAYNFRLPNAMNPHLDKQFTLGHVITMNQTEAQRSFAEWLFWDCAGLYGINTLFLMYSHLHLGHNGIQFYKQLDVFVVLAAVLILWLSFCLYIWGGWTVNF